MITKNQSIDFGGAFSIRGRLKDPFTGRYVDWTDAVFKFVAMDTDTGLIIDTLTAVSDGANASWWTITDSSVADPQSIFNLDVPQAVTTPLTFANAKYTVWVLYPSGLEYALLGGPLIPSDSVPPP